MPACDVSVEAVLVMPISWMFFAVPSLLNQKSLLFISINPALSFSSALKPPRIHNSALTTGEADSGEI